MESIIIPLIVRGRIIEDDLVVHKGRYSDMTFQAPDVGKHLDEIVLRDPLALSDLYRISLDEIYDYLESLGQRLDYRKNPHMAKSLDMLIAAGLYSRQMAICQYEICPSILRRASVEEMVEKNIGRKYLDGWVTETMTDREVAIRAFGARTVHVIAGNSPMVALLTFIMNAVTRSDAIVKIPSNDPYMSTAVARSMIEMAPDHPLTKHVTVAYWKGGDDVVERALYDSKNVEKVVAWGGFAGMRSIRKYLAPGIDLVALDPKISGSIIGREAFASEETMREVAGKAAADVGYMNQGGCMNSKTLFIESGLDAKGIETANRFGELLFDAIQALPVSLSSVHPAFNADLRSEIDGIRYSDAFRVIGGKSSEGAVIVSQEEAEVDFSDLLDCRVANLVPVASIADAMRHVTVHMQTIGIYPDALKAKLRDECALRGSQRIVSLGRALAANWAGPHDAIEPFRRAVRWLRDDTMKKGGGIVLPF
jgi:Acyl-CoA reductase (LuxC)